VRINTVWARVKVAREKLAAHIERLHRADVTIPVGFACPRASRVGARKGSKSLLP
jgi:hypothetical protein